MLEKQIKPGTQPVQIATVPIKLYTRPPVKDPSSGKVIVAAAPVYQKQGGGTTTNPAEAATKPIAHSTAGVVKMRKKGRWFMMALVAWI